jgi:hypothetical protein
MFDRLRESEIETANCLIQACEPRGDAPSSVGFTMKGRSLMRLSHLALTAGLLVSSAAFGDVIHATQVISYTPGTGAVPGYTTPSSALGLPDADTTFGLLTPFHAPFDPSQMVGIGTGGSLVLKLSAPVSTGPGDTLGVHAAVGLEDYNYPFGSTGDGSDSEPLLYTDPRVSTLSVSPDDIHWYTVGTFTFDNPTNYYSQGISTPGLQFATDDPSQVADFAQPFTGSSTSFTSEDWDGVLATLDGSAGGNWFNLSASGFSSISYVKFTEPAGDVMYVDAVVGDPVPEPTTAAIALILGAPLLLRRRRSPTCAKDLR